MKLQFSKPRLIALFDSVIGFISERSTLPILANFLIENKGGVFSVIGSNMEMQAKATDDLGFADDFAFTIPAKKLRDSINAIDAQDITLEISADTNKATLRGGRSKFTLQTLAAAHYPLMKEQEAPAHQFSVPTNVFASGLDLAGFASAVNDSRQMLNATLLEKKAGDDMLNLVATNAHRLSRVKLAYAGAAADEFSIIIPRATVAELGKLCKRHSENVPQVAITVIGNAQIKAVLGNVQILSALIDASYPDYNRVIPVTNQHTCTVNSKALYDAVRRASVIGTDKLKSIAFTFEDGSVNLSIKNEQSEDSTDAVECTYAGPRVAVNFNIAYWVELLTRLNGADITIALQDAQRAINISCAGQDGFTHVIMPLRG